MAEKNLNVSTPRKGMNRDKNPVDLTETEYSFSLNSNIASEIGDSFLLQTEPSTLLCTNFPEGFFVIGREYDVNSDRTFFFSTNPDTGASEIGYITGIVDITNTDDVENICNCNIKNILASPLEDQPQIPICNYSTLLNDSCNLCLNFKKTNPIRKIIIKNETIGTTLWWTDGINPMRYLNVDNISDYLFTGNIICGEDNTIPTCLACEKLRVFKETEHINLEAESIQQGGNLPAGVFEVLAAYSDLNGNEISSYIPITNPISIFDENNTIIDQTQLEYKTNFGIRVRVDNVDTDYPFYKVVIIYTGGINGTSYYELGVYSTSDKEINITTIQGLQPISLARLLVPKKSYEKADGLTASNGTLFWHGTTEQEDINLQPVVNLMGAFLRWQTVETTEDLYKDGVNTSLYKSFMRDEVYPFSFQALFDDGTVSADFPFINRPATPDEISLVNNKDTQSVLAYSTNCSQNDRNKKWQFYNTATDEGFYQGSSSNEYNTVERESIKTCIVNDVFTQPSLEIDIPCITDYTNLADYIEQHREEICVPSSEFYNETLCDILSDPYTDQTCNFIELFDETCDFPPTLVDGSVEIFLETVATEEIETAYVPVEDMIPTNSPQSITCNMYRPGSNTLGYEDDTAFVTSYMEVGDVVYKRNSPGSNTECVYATSLFIDPTTPPSTFLEYAGATTLAALQTAKTSDASGDFTAFVHLKATWFKLEFGDQDTMVFEITKKSECVNSDDIPIGNSIRYTTFTSCSTTSHTASAIVDLNTGVLLELDKADYPSGVAYIAIDAPIDSKANMSGTTYVVSPPCGCFIVLARRLMCDSRTVTVTDAEFSKRARYSSICEFQVPVDNGCNPAAYKYGKFGYWESDNTYPDNEELYNSSDIQIDLDNFPNEFLDEFSQYYIQNGQVVADFRCQPIRHYRFPDFAISPYMSTANNAPFSKAFIYPIGVTIDENIINFFLDTAVENGLLTQERRDRITGYKIKAGDRSLHKSIISKGLAYDMFKYTEVGATNPDPILFPNFPYNDNRPNNLLFTDESRNTFIAHPTSGASNYNFTYHSPETSFGHPALPSELKIEAYQYGYSHGNFVSVEDHVKQVILGKDAYTVATALAIAESVLEVATNVAQLTVNTYSNLFVIAGTSSGTNAGGVGLASVAIGVYIAAELAGGFIKTGQYRKQWLDIIYDLGQPRNFASYYTSIGNYNYALPNTTVGEQLRAIKTNKYLKPGNYYFTEDFSGDTIKVNNRDRESSVYISTGADYPIIYPASYSSFDKSREIASESAGCENSNISSTLEAPIASPYFSLKNYVPSQYGQIGDIKWISTGYIGDLRNPQNFPQVFGGDTFISRFALKRKHSLFKSTAMDLAARTPFNYTIERNVGVPRFYADFGTTEVNSFNDALFPDLATDYTLDCLIGDVSMYVREPSKFYLFYYGIPYFLVETEINTNYRYAREGLENNFYPNIEDFINWTQEKNVPIRQDNTYFYNNVYSKKTTQVQNRSLPIDYSSEYFKKIVYQPNQVFWSLQDTSGTDRFEPWLAYKPLDFYQFDMDLGRLIDLSDIESAQVLGRFENGFLRFNAIDVLRERITPQTQELGTGGIFAERPLEFKRTKLGYGGTQHVEMISSEAGHFWADAKRGQVFRVDQNGEQLTDITNGLTRWFKEHLPFRILKSFPEAEIDNSYNGVGLAMAWDSKYKRLFLTKIDKKPINDCVQYDAELGWVINETLCGEDPELTCPAGYTYNEETGWCERLVTSPICPPGYTYNSTSGNCETAGSETLMCPAGWTYSTVTGLCTNPDDSSTQPANSCSAQCTVIPQPNGNALCVCSSEDINNLCEDCVIIGQKTCQEGYTYNPTTDKCEKLIEPCPPSEGYFTGGVFSNTSFRRIYNSVNNLLDINNGFVQDIQRQQNGKILVGGGFTSTTEGAIKCMFRLNFDGTFDNTFNIGAGFTGTLTSVVPTVWGIDTYEDGKIIAVGDFTTFNGTIVNGIVRLNSDGSIDPTFTPLAGFNTSPLSVRVVEGDKILIGCAGTYRGASTKGILKLLANGDPDPTFTGGNRLDSFTQGNASNEFKQVYSIEIQPDGKYLIGGHFREYSGVLCRKLTRINTNGFIDVTFNVGQGFIDIPTPNPQTNLAYVYKVQMQGNKILVAGKFKTYKGQPVEGIVRLDLAGTLDNTFNNNKVMGGSDASGRTIFDFDTKTGGEILIGGSFTSYDGNATQFITLTDPNGFNQSFADPAFNDAIFAVLNEPRCEVCECPQTSTPEGQILCSCDPQLTDPVCNCIVQESPIYIDDLTPIDICNPDYFEDYSWTAAYSPLTDSWISYYSFKPNYYVSHQDYFQSGINCGTSSLWSHLLTNRSYQVFYGNLYPWVVEVPEKPSLDKKILASLNFSVNSERFHNEYDSAPFPKVGFNEMIIYNQTNNSGLVKLVEEIKNDLRQKTLYPITNSDSQEVLVTKYDDWFKVNFFFNRTKSEENNVLTWVKDNVDVEKTLNMQNIFYNSPLPERMKGNWFLIRFAKTNNSQIKSVFPFNVSKEYLYQ